jgi:hypothetical protein
MTTIEQTMETITPYMEALADATEALENGTSTPSQNLIWLQALSEMWVRESVAQTQQS